MRQHIKIAAASAASMPSEPASGARGTVRPRRRKLITHDARQEGPTDMRTIPVRRDGTLRQVPSELGFEELDELTATYERVLEEERTAEERVGRATAELDQA